MIGLNDFIQYWSAAQLFVENQNFYDPALMGSVQASQGFAATPPLMMWLPPWALLWLMPLLQAEILTSAALWAVVSVTALLTSTLLWIDVLRLPRELRPYLLTASLVFIPTLSTLALGQVSILLFFQVSLGVWLYARQRDFLAGVLLLSLTWKAHLFLIFGTIFAWSVLRDRRFLLPIGFFVGLIGSAVVCYLIAPDSLRFWLQSFTDPAPGAPGKLHWITPTIVGMVRVAFEAREAPVFPMIAIPVIALVASFYGFAIRKQSFELSSDVSLLLCVSFCFAPFAWIFDAVVLLPAYLLLLAGLLERNRSRRMLLIGMLAAVKLLAIVLHGMVFRTHDSFAWFPLLLLGCEAVRYRRALQARTAKTSC